MKALKAAQALVAEGNAGGAAADQQQQQQPEPEKPVLKFRNYEVKDEKHIQHEKVCRWPGGGVCAQQPCAGWLAVVTRRLSPESGLHPTTPAL